VEFGGINEILLKSSTNCVKTAVACTFSAPSSDDQAPEAEVSIAFTTATSVLPPSTLATNATRQRANATGGHAEAFPLNAIIRLNAAKRDRAQDKSIKIRRALVNNTTVRNAIGYRNGDTTPHW
jgi:hypothetical protein